MSGRLKNSLRIIGGVHRGRRLHFIAPEGLRPTTDRVRETLFNWLHRYVPGARVLDLFAGSGALGFEAASRGAVDVVMVESNRKAAEALLNNAKLLQSDENSIKVFNMDARKFLLQDEKPFDIVFLDPPFRKQLLQPSIDLLESNSFLKPSAMIYLEQGGEEEEVQLPGNWEVLRDKRAGQVRYQLIARSTSESQ